MGGITVVTEVIDPELPITWRGLMVVEVCTCSEGPCACRRDNTAESSHRQTMRRLASAGIRGITLQSSEEEAGDGGCPPSPASYVASPWFPSRRTDFSISRTKRFDEAPIVDLEAPFHEYPVRI